MDSSTTLDILIQSIIKTPDEIIEENRHDWVKKQPPTSCFQNRFNKSDALMPHNWKNIYPEYYWLSQRKKNIKRKLTKPDLTPDEITTLNDSLKEINYQLKQTATPVRSPHQ